MLGAVALMPVALLLTDLRAEAGLRDRLDPALQDRLVQVEGVIVGLPVWREGAWRGQIEVERAGWPGTLSGARVADAPEPVQLVLPRRLQVFWGESGLSGPPPRAGAPRAGQRWRLALRLRPVEAPAPLHGPDLALRALEEGLGGQGRVVQRSGVAADRPVLLGETGRARIDRWRQDRREHLFSVLGERPAAGVIAGLSLGDQSAIEREDWALFRLAGLSHLMAISGLHVTMFAWLAGVLIALLWRHGPGLMLMCPAPRAARLGGGAGGAGLRAAVGLGRAGAAHRADAGHGGAAARGGARLADAAPAGAGGGGGGAGRSLGLAAAGLLAVLCRGGAADRLGAARRTDARETGAAARGGRGCASR